MDALCLESALFYTEEITKVESSQERINKRDDKHQNHIDML